MGVLFRRLLKIFTRFSSILLYSIAFMIFNTPDEPLLNLCPLGNLLDKCFGFRSLFMLS
jgi:hypothetical protein